MTDEAIPFAVVDRLLNKGAPVDMAARMTQLRVVDGSIAFYEPLSEDVVLWDADSGHLWSLSGRAFALGEENVRDPATYAFDNSLLIHPDPLSWLIGRAHGIVVLRWDLAFDWLRDVPRVTVGQSLVDEYTAAMRTALPEVFVEVEAMLAA